MFPIWYAQLTLNSVALVPSVSFCPQMQQRLLFLPFFFLFFFHVLIIANLLFGCRQYFLNKLQKVQNNAASLVLRFSKTGHSFPHLPSLHWLPIDSRIQYKPSSLCYNCLSSTAPDFLTELLRIYKPIRQLRSSFDTSILCIPTVRTHSLGQRSFSYAASTVWNTLPCEIQVIQHDLILQIIT